MNFIKEEDEKRNDYILQKDKTTKGVTKFVILALAICIIGVVASGLYFNGFKI